MSKRRLNDDFLDNKAGQRNSNGKLPKVNEANPNELPMSHNFTRNFKRNNLPQFIKPGSKVYIQNHQTVKELQEETQTPPSGVIYKFPFISETTMVLSADGKPVLFFIKDGLQLPFKYTAADKGQP